MVSATNAKVIQTLYRVPEQVAEFLILLIENPTVSTAEIIAKVGPAHAPVLVWRSRRLIEGLIEKNRIETDDPDLFEIQTQRGNGYFISPDAQKYFKKAIADARVEYGWV